MHFDFKSAARCVARLSVLALLSYSKCSAEPVPIYLKTDDRAVFYGDSTGSTDKYPKYATVDLAEYRSLCKIVVGVPNFGWTKTVVVSLSEDGKTYTDVGSYVFSLTKEEKHEFDFPSMEARHIRLAYVDHYTEPVQNAGFLFTTEIQAYGPPN